jgi:predicted PurR-regulated permease PerM
MQTASFDQREANAMAPRGKALGDFIRESFSILGTYFIGRVKISILLGILCYVILMPFDVRYKGMISVIVGFTNLLPYIGPIVSMTLTAIIAAFQGAAVVLWILLLNLGLQVLDSILLSPMILGKSLAIPPMVIFTATLIGSSVFGFWGVLFAVPAAAILSLLVKKWMGQHDRRRP